MSAPALSLWYELAALAGPVWERLASKGLRRLRILADGEILTSVLLVDGPGDVLRAVASGLERRPAPGLVEVYGVRQGAGAASLVLIVKLGAPAEAVAPGVAA